jgi:heme-degrading monooxygenase HmoA
MRARTGRLEVSPERIDDVVEILMAEQVPRYRGQRGYKGFRVLADRESGAIIGVSFWEREEDLEAAEELGEQARSQAAEAGQAGVEPVTERWEVVLDDTP